MISSWSIPVSQYVESAIKRKQFGSVICVAQDQNQHTTVINIETVRNFQLKKHYK